MKYGLPYMGSKNKLAERIVGLLPRADHLVDLFCGGCAVSHAALTRRKWPHVHINDVDFRPVQLFQDALAGRYSEETRWISREDFHRLKDTDPYVAIVWSFGNNMRDYLYSAEIEPLKRAIHYAMFFADYQPAALLGHDLSFIDPISDLQKRYLAVKRYFSRLGHFQQQSFEGGGESECSPKNQPGDTSAFKKKRAQATKRDGEQRATELHCTDCSTGSGPARCQPAWGGGERPLLTSTVGDYEAVSIPDRSVIYCDIPYEATQVYDKAAQFDYERFYDWCSRQTQPVFISSYTMPADRFVCIEEFTHRCTLSASANNAVTERIFIPRHQPAPRRPQQLELFGEELKQ